jgi:hypothetical protein
MACSGSLGIPRANNPHPVFRGTDRADCCQRYRNKPSICSSQVMSAYAAQLGNPERETS